MTTTIIAIITLIIGLVLGIFIKKSETDSLLKEKNNYIQKNNELNAEIQKLNSEIASDKTKLEMLAQLREMVEKDFTAIANKVIKEEQSDLREQNREALEEKIKPLKENFERFKEKVEEFNKQGETNTATIKTQIEMLLKESTSIKTTANDLSNAIKSNSQVRGDFGEIILENLLQQAGLINKNDDTEKGNYITQHTYKDLSAPTERPRPDAVVFFPDNKNIVIDSKCPLNNFVEFANCRENDEKEVQLNLFYKSVSGMIDDLSEKYNTLEGLNTPPFKLMFIPLEACAGYIYANKNIVQKAADKNIIIVCPSTLLVTLKLINKVWVEKNRQEQLEDIIKTATSTYKALQLFVERAEGFKNKITKLDEDFDNMMKPVSGNQGIIKKIASLEKLGLAINKKISTKLVEDIQSENE